MKRALLLLPALTLVLPGGAAQAARAGNAKPRAVVTATPVSDPDRFGRVDVLIHVDAADPDGQITELSIDLGDGVVVSMLLACDPDAPAGTPATQELTWKYGPGQYTIRAVAFSTPDCFSGPFQQSRPAVAKLNVP
ncbi:MAG: hypothetical protein ACRDJ1_07885 [Actinomycetota bacterium]